MKELKITTSFTVYEQLEELPEEILSLMQKAVESRQKAYAPYSEFRVGAALLLDNGEVVLGNNQENACYPSGLCAERVAIYHAGAIYPDARITAIAITASSDNYEVKDPAPPCGACRQSIAEYEIKQKQPIPIYFMGKSGKILKSDSVKNLLPLTFDSSFL
ncbi:cytidine deaminase [Leptobacterium flavescens]|uniref:Cytidine deaminase n=1 Tax=Leptobacterium flavescens TaxID=472055 RepID=A0A6P0UR40_9FLAO|nr:cytidine deaminase [Leptobacterium flavescens]NER15002.1 cytidine deaminase [Leptobacterium flavescens]